MESHLGSDVILPWDAVGSHGISRANCLGVARKTPWDVPWEPMGRHGITWDVILISGRAFGFWIYGVTEIVAVHRIRLILPRKRNIQLACKIHDQSAPKAPAGNSPLPVESGEIPWNPVVSHGIP